MYMNFLGMINKTFSTNLPENISKLIFDNNVRVCGQICN